MRTVHKYQVSDFGNIIAAMPSGAEIIEFHEQHRNLCFWALVETDNPIIERRFEIYGTGHEIPPQRKYVATAHVGTYVWHLFEVMV